MTQSNSKYFDDFCDVVEPLHATDYPDWDAHLFRLLFDNVSAIAFPGQALGCTHLLEYKIEFLPNTPSVYIPDYRPPRSQHETATRKTNEILRMVWLNFPLHLRIALSSTCQGKMVISAPFFLRRFNQCTVSQRYPLPVLAHLLQPLGEYNAVFSSLHLMSGLWKRPLARKSRLSLLSAPLQVTFSTRVSQWV